jgi:hypothetical protein
MSKAATQQALRTETWFITPQMPGCCVMEKEARRLGTKTLHFLTLLFSLHMVHRPVVFVEDTFNLYDSSKLPTAKGVV